MPLSFDNLRQTSPLFHDPEKLKQSYTLSSRDSLKIAGIAFASIILPRALADAFLPNKKISFSVSHLSSLGLTVVSWALLAGGCYAFIAKEKQKNALKLFQSFPHSYSRWGKVATKISFFLSVTLGFYLPSRQHFILADTINGWARGKIPIKLHLELLKLATSCLLTPLIVAYTTKYLCASTQFPERDIESLKKEDSSLRKDFCSLHEQVQKEDWIANIEQERLKKECDRWLNDSKNDHLKDYLNYPPCFPLDQLLLILNHESFIAGTLTDLPELLKDEDETYLEACKEAYKKIKAAFTDDTKSLKELLFPGYLSLDSEKNPFQSLRAYESLPTLQWPFLEKTKEKTIFRSLNKVAKYGESPTEILKHFVEQEPYFSTTSFSVEKDEIPDELQIPGDDTKTKEKLQAYKSAYDEIKIDSTKTLEENLKVTDSTKTLREHLEHHLELERLHRDWKIFTTLFQNLPYLMGKAPELLQKPTSNTDQYKKAEEASDPFKVQDEHSKLDSKKTLEKLKLYYQLAEAISNADTFNTIRAKKAHFENAASYLNTDGQQDPFFKIIQGIK